MALSGESFEHFVREVCGWGIDDSRGGKAVIVIPVNKENEAKGTVVKEEVRFDRMCPAHFFLDPVDMELQNSRESSGEPTSSRHRHESKSKWEPWHFAFSASRGGMGGEGYRCLDTVAEFDMVL